MGTFSETLVFNGWQVVEELSIGRSAFGDVYRVRDTKRLHTRSYALKLFRGEFLADVQTLAAIGHQNVVVHIDHGICTTMGYEGRAFLVMELAESTLEAEHDAGRLDEDALSAVADEVLTALEYLHTKRRVVHRDVKLANVLLVAGEWKLADFGLAARLDGAGRAINPFPARDPHYSAPECFDTPPVDTAAVDVFAFGATMHQLLCRKGVWDSAALERIMAMDDPGEPIISPDLPAAWRPLVVGCLVPHGARLDATAARALVPPVGGRRARAVLWGGRQPSRGQFAPNRCLPVVPSQGRAAARTST